VRAQWHSSVTSGSDLHSTHNADRSGGLNRVRLVRIQGSDEGIEARISLEVDKHAGEP
jgi:hypothetical protein